ncbi:MAG TPA: hypothetical protein VHY76_10210 [Acetobacteraceae bacterium]|nr:hypothetical protein [Acetobacteraceae bacterium]
MIWRMLACAALLAGGITLVPAAHAQQTTNGRASGTTTSGTTSGPASGAAATAGNGQGRAIGGAAGTKAKSGSESGPAPQKPANGASGTQH